MRLSPRQTMRSFLLAEANRLMHDGLPRTESLKKLYRRSRRPENSRSREYVFLYALESGRLADLEALFDEPDPPLEGAFAVMRPRDAVPAREQYAAPLELAGGYEGDAEGFLRDNGEALGKRYYQVLAAYRHPDYERAACMRLNALRRDRVLAAMSESGEGVCSLAARTGLNKGNLCAFLKGDLSKLSRDAAKRAALAAEQPHAAPPAP